MYNESGMRKAISKKTIGCDGGNAMKVKDKWIALLLCFFFGYVGVHKFYEGKIGMGILYVFTFGLFGIGWLVDLFVLLFKTSPHYRKQKTLPIIDYRATS